MCALGVVLSSLGLALIWALLIAVLVLQQRTLPKQDGILTLKGLLEPVEIIHDTDGLIRIKAQHKQDLV